MCNSIFNAHSIYTCYVCKTNEFLCTFNPLCAMPQCTIKTLHKSSCVSMSNVTTLDKSTCVSMSNHPKGFNWEYLCHVLESSGDLNYRLFFKYLPSSGIAPCVGTAGTLHDTYT